MNLYQFTYLKTIAVNLPEQHTVAPHVGLGGELAEEDALRGHPPEGYKGLGLHSVIIRRINIS